MCEVTSKLPVQISPFLYYDYPLLHEVPSGKKMYHNSQISKLNFDNREAATQKNIIIK